MAATVAASKAYDLSGGALREDLEDVVYDISPMDTWFMTTAGRGRCKSTSHEWLIDALGAVAANKQIEGDNFTAVARTLPSRLKNYTQISNKSIEVTETSRAVDNAGFADLMAYSTARAAKEVKRDMETAMLGNNPASAGTSVSARVSAGVANWTTTENHIKQVPTASTVAIASGYATGAVTAGSSTAFTSALLVEGLQVCWSVGGETDTVLTTASVYQTISAFTGIATRFRDVGSRQQAQIIGAADVYVSAFGSHNIRISRYIPSTYCYLLDMKTWRVDYLRPFATQDIAKVGDSTRKLIVAEWTLVTQSPTANAKFTGVV